MNKQKKEWLKLKAAANFLGYKILAGTITQEGREELKRLTKLLKLKAI